TMIKIKSIIIFLLLIYPASLCGQNNDTINRTDKNGRRQGYWIQKYPGGNIRYEGYFIDNHPAGVFKRYYENDTVQSMLFYSSDGHEADAIFFHFNGFIAAAGKYVNQKREGNWEFFSSIIEGYMVAREEYHNNMRNGFTVKFYPDKTIAEKIEYTNNIKHGEWTQYHPNGKIFLKTSYVNGELNGSFEVWDKNGKQIYKGQYKNDRRDGIWYLYNPDGTVKNEIKYVNGLAINPELYRKENAFLDSLTIERKDLADPEKTGTIW
ncbi:MAG: toxin-antitoxin system YwqK family antitoxin, partial [Bacteroidales bacterium]